MNRKSRKNYMRISQKLLAGLGISVFIGACITMVTYNFWPRELRGESVGSCGVNTSSATEYGRPLWYYRENFFETGAVSAQAANCAAEDMIHVGANNSPAYTDQLETANPEDLPDTEWRYGYIVADTLFWTFINGPIVIGTSKLLRRHGR
jgi:hypothetical protein